MCICVVTLEKKMNRNHLLLKFFEVKLLVYQEDTTELRLKVELKLRLAFVLDNAEFFFHIHYSHDHLDIITFIVIIHYNLKC